MTDKHKLLQKWHDVFPIALFSLVWIWLIALTYYVSGNILDADASNVLVLSNFLAQQNTIISSGWRYYTELHVINMQLIYSFFFHFFDSWRLVRFFGTITLQAILVISYWYFCRQAKIPRNTFFYSATVLLLPVSVTYGRIVLLHGHYAFHIALAFFIIGLLIRLSTNRPVKKLNYGLALAIYFVLCFLSGTNGMRQLYISLAPAFVVSLYLYLRSKPFADIAHGQKSDGRTLRSRLLAACRSSAEGRGLMFALTGAVVNGIGIVTNIVVLRRIFAFSTYYSMRTVAPSGTAIVDQMNDLLDLFGYRDGARLFSLEGICSLLALLSFAFAIGFSIWYFIHANKESVYVKRFLSIFLFGSLILQTTVFLITSVYYIHYYTLVYVFVTILLMILIDEFPGRAIRLPRICAGLMIVGFLLSGAVTTNYLINKPESYATKYEGLSYSNIDLVQQIKPAAEYLEENGYTFGYAYYWNSSVVTELTDGKVEVCALTDPPTITYSFANTKKAFWDIDYHQGKTFVLFEKNDMDYEEYSIFEGGTEVYSDDYYKIFEYPGPIQFEISSMAG